MRIKLNIMLSETSDKDKKNWLSHSIVVSRELKQGNGQCIIMTSPWPCILNSD